MSTIPTASIICQPSAKRSPTKPTVRALPNALPIQRCKKSLAVDLALITSYAERLRDVELTIVTTANHHDANTRYLLQTVPGIGTILSLVLLYDIHQIDRFPRVQDVLSSCRLGKCRKASAGKRRGTSGATIGNAHLTGAFSEAAVLFLRDHPAAQQYLARLEKKHAKGKAFTILAQKLARAVSSRLTRQVAFDTETFSNEKGGERRSLKPHWTTKGMPLKEALNTAACLASVHAKVPQVTIP